MRNRKVQILCGLAAGALAIGIFYATRENDPVYQGKRLSEYLVAFEGSYASSGFDVGPGGPMAGDINLVSTDAKAFAAIDAVGTNALSMLVRMLAQHDTPMGRWIQTQRAKSKLSRRFIPYNLVSGTRDRMKALAAFYRLGPKAAPIVPKIIPLLDNPDCATLAIFALQYIRPEDEHHILSLTNVLRIQPRSTRSFFQKFGQNNFVETGILQYQALLTLSSFGTKASNAIPVLLDSLHSTNDLIQAAAAAALFRIGAPAEKVMPPIITSLSDTNTLFAKSSAGMGGSAGMRNEMWRDMRVRTSIWVLGQYGRQASNAIPVLSQFENSPSYPIRAALQEVLRKIRGDTEATTKAALDEALGKVRADAERNLR